MIASVSNLAQQALPPGGWAILALVLIICLSYVGALFWSAVGRRETKPAPKQPTPQNLAPQQRRMVPVASSRPVKKADQPVAANDGHPAASNAAVEAPPTSSAPVTAAPLPVEAAPSPAEAAPETVLVVEPEPSPSPIVESPSPIVETPFPAAETPPDNLQRIEGIGPKIASVLSSAGITTFDQLAKMDSDQIRAVLAGQVRIFNPDSWPAQARLAAAGQWDALTSFQNELKAGRRV